MASFKEHIKNLISELADKHLLTFLKNQLKDCESVLDIGYGVHSPVGRISRNFYLEGIDILKPPRKKELRIHDAYKIGDIKKLKKLYKPKSFDAAVLLDVIEHLKKSDGLKILKDMEYIVKKKIIILTPSGFLAQGAIDGNQYMRHLSGWNEHDFKKEGYTSYGMNGIKILRGDQAKIKYKPWYVWLVISFLSQYITHYFPRFAFHIIAVKSNINNNYGK